MVWVGGGATREDRKWHFEEEEDGGGNRTAHDEGRGGRGPIKSGVVKSEKEGLMLFFSYVHLRLIG